MTDLSPFPDLNQAVRAAIGDLVGGDAHTGTVTPSNLQGVLPFIRVQRFGGADDLLTDTARVAVDYFAATYADAQAGAEAVRQRLITRPLVTAPGVIDRVTTTLAPHEIPWDDPKVRRFTATYTVSARR